MSLWKCQETINNAVQILDPSAKLTSTRHLLGSKKTRGLVILIFCPSAYCTTRYINHNDKKNSLLM